MAYPFMAYEAKGWKGDAREGRRQVCLAAMAYLDLLDDLASDPASGSRRNFQTGTSQDNQVFALTSFGAHWHVLVAFKKRRSISRFAGVEGLSKNVYVSYRDFKLLPEPKIRSSFANSNCG